MKASSDSVKTGYLDSGYPLWPCGKNQGLQMLFLAGAEARNLCHVSAEGAVSFLDGCFFG